jgi:hypothetical protein
MAKFDNRFLIIPLVMAVVILISGVLMVMKMNSHPPERVKQDDTGPRLVRQWKVGDDAKPRIHKLYETVVDGEKIRYVVEDVKYPESEAMSTEVLTHGVQE